MSSSKRKMLKRSLKIRSIISGILLLLAMAVFIFAIRGVVLSGLSGTTVLCGFSMLILFFGAGYFFAPVLKNKEKQKAIAMEKKR